MDNNLKKILHKTSGTSQRERRLHALMPGGLQIDTREIQDLLNDIYAVSQKIRFAGKQTDSPTNWAAFFEKSPAFLLASILSNEPDDWANRMREIIRQFYGSGIDNEIKACSSGLEVLKDMFSLINSWYERSEALLKWKEKTAINIVLEQAIQSDLKPAWRQYRALLKSMEKVGMVFQTAEKDTAFTHMHPLWHDDEGLSETDPLNELERSQQWMMVIEQLRQLFQRLLFTMTLLEKKAGIWLSESLEQHNDHDPHIGLLLSFLQLFKHARNQLNSKPVEHLNYYYFDILKQQLKPHTPDRTVVCFELNEHVNSLLLPKNTSLLAGINETGLASTYATTQDLFLTQTKIAQLSTIHVAKNGMVKTGSSYKLVSGIYAAPIANSENGLGKPFSTADHSWPPFGEEQLEKAPSERQMTDAQIGFILASPVLWLQEGERSIHMRFEFAKAPIARLFDLIEDISINTQTSADDVAAKLFANALLIDVSTPEGWFRIKRWQIDSLKEWKSHQAICINAYLSMEDPPLTDNNPATIGTDYQTPWPLIRIGMNPDADVYLYSFVHALDVEFIRIETEVSGMKALQMNSDLGPLDSSAPFMPFGPIPAKNACLLIGNAELFRKRLTDLKIHLEWNRVPESETGFAGHYQSYDQGINNHSFKIRLSALSSYSFKPVEAVNQQTFNLFNAEGPDTPVSNHTIIEGVQLEQMRIQPDYNLTQLAPYSNLSRSGYFKLQLSEPLRAFGHADYQRLFTTYLLAQTRPGKKSEALETPPNEPFVPVVNRISISYKAASEINLRPLNSNENDPSAGEKIITLHPFGHQEIFAEGKGISQNLFPRFDEDGYLYIGLTQVTPGSVLPLYFQVQESKLRQKPWDIYNIYGSFLQGNQWEPFKQEHMLSDTSRGFSTSGILTLQLPEVIDTNSTQMPSGLFWIRIAAKGNLEPIGRILQVYPHAVEVVWENNGDESHFDSGKPLPTIQALVQPKSEIAQVIQPGGFYGGCPQETMEQFYIRTSERLRHKNRGISTWDIEHLVLEAFPIVRRAKCITPLVDDKIQAGNLRVIVLPDAPPTDLTPMLGFYQLTTIRQFLANKLSPFVEIKVLNPVYEKIKVTCSVLLQKGLEHEKGKHLKILHDDLQDFICPWLKSGRIQMGGSISKNDLLDFIYNRPYIRFVTGFSMVHIYEQDNNEFTLSDTAHADQAYEIIRASTPWSILIPVDMHQIDFMDQEDYVLPDQTAIDVMRLGTDFVIVASEPEPPGSNTENKLFASDTEFDFSGESFLIPNI